MALTPVVVFVYNRPEHFRKTIESLEKNILADGTELIIFSDGPKDARDEQGVDSVRRFAGVVKGFKNVEIIKRPSNMGLSQSVITGLNEIFNLYENAIILEDDMVTSAYFLKYMNDALNLYKEEDRVISIHGYFYPVQRLLPETFFLRGADCWGWSTWKRGWRLFNPDAQELLQEIHQKNLEKEFNFGGSFSYTKMLSDNAKGKNDSWAIRWYASAFLKNKLTLYPGRSLIQNIGIDNSGTHCKNVDYFNVSLAEKAVRVGGIEIIENQTAREAFQEYMKAIRSKKNSRRITRIIDFIKSPLMRSAS